MNPNAANYLSDDQIHTIGSWAEFQEHVDHPQFRRWAFRGQEQSGWHLNSTLSRHLVDFGVHRDVWAHQEDRIIRIFCRKAQSLPQRMPQKDDVFQVLALMQHHGAPTRLMDFTWSPFVAAFFALEKARGDCAV
jgi:hypothetical protein